MKTNNRMAQYIADRDVVKHVSKASARIVWTDLKMEGWRAEGRTLVKVDEHEHHFIFEVYGEKVAIRYREMEVAS